VPGLDDEDDDASRPPPDPLDRLWFHPSEMRSLARDGGSTATPRRRTPRWLGPFAAGAVAVGFIVLVVVTALDTSSQSPISPGVTGFQSAEATARIIATAGASVVTVQIARADGTSTASGVCVEKGSVLTSAHTLEGATAVTLVTVNGASFPALPAGYDPDTDLALLRIPPSKLPPARLGSSDDLQEGSPVLGLAAGSDDNHWVSAGTLRAFDELATTPAGAVLAGLMETETGAESKHTGGAVVDPSGEVVGILTVPSDAPASGLAVPIDLAREVADQLVDKGTVTHAWLGVVGTDDKDRAGGGARVDQVTPASPAEKAGLAAGDVIVAVGDDSTTTSVSAMAELMGEVRRRQPGRSLELTVLRDGGQRRVPVELGEKEPGTAPDAVATTMPPPTPQP
jgi:putative serine protease PepD